MNWDSTAVDIDPAFENVSMENASYLQNTENTFDNKIYYSSHTTRLVDIDIDLKIHISISI